MSEMVERVARALALSAGGRMLQGGYHVATREFAWEPDGGAERKYVERHWREHVHAATFAIEAMREPTEDMVATGDEKIIEALNDHTGVLRIPTPAQASFQAMIDEALK